VEAQGLGLLLKHYQAPGPSFLEHTSQSAGTASGKLKYRTPVNTGVAAGRDLPSAAQSFVFLIDSDNTAPFSSLGISISNALPLPDSFQSAMTRLLSGPVTGLLSSDIPRLVTVKTELPESSARIVA
jgi:hypothetical protein